MQDQKRERACRRTDCGKNKNDAMASIQEELVNSFEEVQGLGDITVDSGAVKCVWRIQKKGVLKLAAANGSAIWVEGDAKLKGI